MLMKATENWGNPSKEYQSKQQQICQSILKLDITSSQIDTFGLKLFMQSKVLFTIYIHHQNVDVTRS